MKNTTLGRKASNTMKSNEGLYKPKTAINQKGDGADFAFNGQMGDGVNGHGTNGRYSGNQVGLSMKENYGSGPRHGNQSDSGDERGIGPSATKDKQSQTIATASQGHNIGRATTPRGFKNPDAINVGMKG